MNVIQMHQIIIHEKSSPTGLVLELRYFDIKQKSTLYPDPKYLICKTKKRPHLMLEANFLKSHVIMKDICNKFIELKFSVGFIVWA